MARTAIGTATLYDIADGPEGAFTSFIYKSSASKPSLPSGGSFNGTTETPPSGWSVDSVYVQGVKTWVTSTRYNHNGSSWSHGAWGPVSESVIPGDKGNPGLRGSQHFYATTTGTTWNNTHANNAVTNAGFAQNQPNDRVTLTNTAQGYAEERFWDGGAWATIDQVIPGNLIVEKSLSAEKIAVNNLAAISANVGELEGGILTGSTVRTATSGKRVVLSNSDVPLAVYNNNNSLIFGTTTKDGGSDVEVFFNGRLANNIVSDAYFLTAAGVSSMRARLGLLEPSAPTGGTISDGVGAKITGDFQITHESIFSGGKVMTLRLQGSASIDWNNGSTQSTQIPKITVQFYIRTSTNNSTWGQWEPEGTLKTITGSISNDYQDFGGEPGYTNYYLATQSIGLNVTEPVGTVDGKYYQVRAVVTKTVGQINLNSSVNSSMTSFIADEPASAVVAAHQHDWNTDIINKPTTIDNANKLGGLSLHTGRNNLANRVVRTDGSGYIQAGWINTTSGVASGTPARIYCSQDSYLRYYTPASLAPYILNQGSTKNSHTHSEYVTTTALNGYGLGSLSSRISSPDAILYNSVKALDVSAGTGEPSGANDGLLTTKMWDAASYGVQSFHDFHQNEIHIRQRNNSSWSAWKQLATTDGAGVSGTWGISVTGNAATATWADKVDVNTSTSTGVFPMLWSSGDTVYNTSSRGVQYQPSTGKISIISTSYRQAGMYGLYNSYKTGHIWSMGTAYAISANGANFGNLYGLAYKHTNNGTGGSMAGGHQMVWCQNGYPKAALGTNIWTSGNVTAYSDIRVKKNLKRLVNALGKIDRLNGYTYDRTDTTPDPDEAPALHNPTDRHVGVIAQEVLKVLPEAVTGGPTKKDLQGHYSVAYGNLVALLIEGIKELNREKRQLTSRVERLENGRIT